MMVRKQKTDARDAAHVLELLRTERFPRIWRAGWTYVYDGDGERVKKVNGSAGTLYWSGMGGDPIAESSLTGANLEEYIFFNGQRVAWRDVTGSVVHYYFSDHLGSTDVITSNTGAIQKESDYFPYGGEITVTGSDANNYKFTGKERDNESGLDNFRARYDSSSLGRFMSPDPLGGQLVDPQTLNKYSYVANNPITFTDPMGMYKCADSEKCDSDQDIAFEKARQNDLSQKDENVVRGAESYGDPTKDNDVTVGFGDPGKGNDGITKSELEVDPNNTSQMRAAETVTIRDGLSGTALDAARRP